MIVTRVEAVTKTKYKVYVDGQFAFILYKGELSRFHIAEDQELSQESYEKIRTEVILKRAKLRAMHLLNDMWRTEAQLREKLTRNEYPADIVEAAISYVKSFGYINDYEYARSFIESRKERKSRREIYMQLVGKGVSRELIDEAFEESYEREDSTEAIRRWKKRKKLWRTLSEKVLVMMISEKPCRYMSVRCTVDIKKTDLNYRSFQWLSLTSFTKQYRI